MTDSIGFNPTVSILASGRTNIGGLFASTVATYGDEIAMVDGERTISFRALNQQANQWANAFESQVTKYLRSNFPSGKEEYPTGVSNIDYFIPQANLAIEIDGSSHFYSTTNHRLNKN